MPIPNDHESHDPALVAAHAAGDLVGAQLILARRLLASCSDCADLHADLRAIAAATRALPALATAPRDYRLTSDQASRLRGGGLVRRLIRGFADPSSGLRPLATTFSGLGVIGLAIVLLLPVLGGPTALSGLERETFSALGPSATVAPQVDAVPGGAMAAPTAGSGAFGSESAAPGDQKAELDGDRTGDEETAPRSTIAASDGPDAATIVLLGSAVLLVTGLVLFALRIIANRLA